MSAAPDELLYLLHHALARRDWNAVLAERERAEGVITSGVSRFAQVRIRQAFAVALLGNSDPTCVEEFASCLDLVGEADDNSSLRLRAELLGDLSRYYRQTGIDFDEAIRISVQARECYLRLDDADGVATCELDLGNLAEYQGDLDAAARHYGEAVRVLSSIGPSRHLAAAWQYRGSLEEGRERYDEAREAYCQESLVLTELANTNDDDISRNWHACVRTAALCTDFDQAERMLSSPHPAAAADPTGIDWLNSYLQRAKEIFSALAEAETIDEAIAAIEVRDGGLDVLLIRAFGTRLRILDVSQPPSPPPRPEPGPTFELYEVLYSELQEHPASTAAAVSFTDFLLVARELVWADAARLSQSVAAVRRACELHLSEDSPEVGVLFERASQLFRHARDLLPGRGTDAIHFARLAFTRLRRDAHPDVRASATLTLANALWLCSTVEAGTRRATWLMRIALRINGISSSVRATIVLNLGMALASRAFGAPSEPENAIALLEQANVDLPPSADRSPLSWSLAELYSDREFGDRLQNLGAAISWYARAGNQNRDRLDTTHWAWARLREARLRAQRDLPGDSTMADEALREAILVFSEEALHDPWGRACLADELATHMAQMVSEPEAMQYLIKLHSESVEYFVNAGAVEHERALVNRAASLVHLSLLETNPARSNSAMRAALTDFSTAIDSARTRGDERPDALWRRAAAMAQPGVEMPQTHLPVIDRAQADVRSALDARMGQPSTPWTIRAHASLGAFARLKSDAQSEVEHLSDALLIADEVYGNLLLPHLRAQLLGLVGEFAVQTAIALVRVGEPGRAVEVVELWTARFQRDFLAMPGLERLAPELVDELERSRSIVRRLTVDGLSQVATQGSHRDSGVSAQREAIAVSERFMDRVGRLVTTEPSEDPLPPPPSGVALCRVLSSGRETAVIATTFVGGTRAEAGTLLRREGPATGGDLLESFGEAKDATSANDWSATEESERRIVQEFWALVSAAEVSMPRRVVVLGGSASEGPRLTTSNAWEDDSGTAAHVVTSWAPSERAFIDSFDAARALAMEPRTFSSAGEPPADLPFARAERADLESRWGAKGLSGTFLHIAAHGFFSPGQPYESVIQFADHDRSLADLLDSDDLSRKRIVFFGACMTADSTTAMGSLQPLGFATAALLAGTPGVVASLGSVNDLAAALLATRLVQQLFTTTESWEAVDLALELKEARRWLRSLGAAETFKWLDEHEQLAEAVGVVEPGFVSWAAANPESHPFAAPRFWRPFVAIGY